MPLRDLSLLIVEDDPIAREQFRLYFQEEFGQIFQAGDGEEGLESFRRHAPDIVLTDLRMPRLHGLEMIREMRREIPEQPVVILSAHDDQETLLNSLNLAVDGFIPKPVLDLSRVRHIFEGIATKIQIRRERLNDFYRKAYFDSLTGIYNRNYFDAHLQDLLDGACGTEPLALFFIDMDNLKTINDTFGHAAGDQALIALAKYLREIVPREGSVIRLGGDEFAMILPGFDRARAQVFIEEIEYCQVVSVMPEGDALRITFSLGCSLCPEDAGNALEMLRQADAAMYQAKQAGKGRCCMYREVCG